MKRVSSRIHWAARKRFQSISVREHATDLDGAEGGSSSPEREKFMDDETPYYEDDDEKCFDEQQTADGVEGEEEKYMDEGEGGDAERKVCVYALCLLRDGTDLVFVIATI